MKKEEILKNILFADMRADESLKLFSDERIKGTIANWLHIDSTWKSIYRAMEEYKNQELEEHKSSNKGSCEY